MADQLQPLIDRIQKEAVGEAEEQAGRIVEEAQAKAREIVREAEEAATRHKEEAEREAEAYAERSRRTLEQAARDVLLSLEQGVEGILSGLVAEELNEVLTTEGLRELLGKLIDAYLDQEGAEHRIEVLLGSQDHDKLVEHFRQQYGAALNQGVEIHLDAAITRGFRIALDQGSVSHDFTREALVEALSAHLRPRLAEAVQQATKSDSGN